MKKITNKAIRQRETLMERIKGPTTHHHKVRHHTIHKNPEDVLNPEMTLKARQRYRDKQSVNRGVMRGR